MFLVSFVLKITNISHLAGKVSKRDDVLLLSDLALNGGSILAGGLGLRELDVESLDFTGKLQDLVLDLANVELISYSQQHMSVLSIIECKENRMRTISTRSRLDLGVELVRLC